MIEAATGQAFDHALEIGKRGNPPFRPAEIYPKLPSGDSGDLLVHSSPLHCLLGSFGLSQSGT